MKATWQASVDTPHHETGPFGIYFARFTHQKTKEKKRKEKRETRLEMGLTDLKALTVADGAAFLCGIAAAATAAEAAAATTFEACLTRGSPYTTSSERIEQSEK